MKRYWSKRNVLAVLALAIIWAPISGEAAEPVRVAVTGTNYCLGCALKQEKGAAAQCSIYGHRHALKVERVVGDGDFSALNGATLHYLDNDKSNDLFKGTSFHDKRIEVKGRLYTDERVIEVEAVREVAE